MQVSITSNHNRNIGGRQTGDMSHNRRNFIPNNVDRRLVKNNFIFKNVTIGEVYEDAFGDSIDVYNKKQKRKDRIKYDRKSYFEYLFKADPTEKRAQRILTSNARGGNEISSFSEEIFQVSDCYEFGNFLRNSNGDLIDKNGNPIKWNSDKNKFYDINGNEVKNSKNLIPNPNAEVVKEILSTFYMGGRFEIVQDKNGVPSLKRLEENETAENEIVMPSFEERNANFKVITAVMHNDEWHGTPHIHIDYVAVGEGYTKGPEKQVGFERALKNMGFEDKRTAYTEWREKERVILKQICGYYGLETKSKEEEFSRGESYSTKVYRKAIRDGKAEAEKIIEKAKQNAKAITDKAVSEAYAIIARAEQDAEAVTKQADEYAQDTKNRASEEAKQIVNTAKQEAAELQAENKLLAEKNEEAQHEIEEKRKQIVNLYNLAAKFPKKKMFSRDTYTFDKETYDALMEAMAYHAELVNNTFTSDKDRQAIADELKRQKEITANMEQEVRQQAKQMVAPHIKALNDEHERNKKEWDKENETNKIKTELKIKAKYKGCIEYFAGKPIDEAITEFNNFTKQKQLAKTVQNNNIRQNENDISDNFEK